MEKEPKKSTDQKLRLTLPIKLILLYILVIFGVFAVLWVIFAIVRAFSDGPIFSEDRDVATFFLSLTVAAIIMGLFALVIYKTVVTRIRRLNDATKEVSRGNFDIKIATAGRDELSELAESFNNMSRELKANEYLSKDFVRNVSHEFKTPISVIRAYGELLELESNGNKTIKEYADIIVNESDRLTAMTKSILQLSLLDSTMIVKRDDIFSPDEQIREILRLLEVRRSEKSIKLDLELCKLTITDNEQLLYHVWQNLISNAVKFCDDGGTIRIVLSYKEGSGLYFEISNTGPGISDEDKDKIFLQFYVGDKSRNTEGSGLGLSIVKKIVTKLGGQITVESPREQGVRFVVRV